MKSIDPEISIDKLTELFGKTRQGYYYKLKYNHFIDIDSDKIVELVNAERKYMPKLGTVKLYHNLKSKFILNEIKIGRDKLNNVLSCSNLLIARHKRFAKTTNSNHRNKRYKDKVKGLVIDRSNQVWVSDITYVTLKSDFAYLSLITDAYSKKILG
ncbi:MAG: hypothetical protein NTW25_01240 [Candidatus Kapabacteria bacterium]|nr:hypothetical protein [Candidatus Kapabacteria bacterium]